MERDRLGRISKSNRFKIVNTLATLIAEEYSGNATHKEIAFICQETITLFPALKGVNQSIGCIVSIIQQNLAIIFDIYYYCLYL